MCQHTRVIYLMCHLHPLTYALARHHIRYIWAWRFEHCQHLSDILRPGSARVRRKTAGAEPAIRGQRGNDHSNSTPFHLRAGRARKLEGRWAAFYSAVGTDWSE